MMKKTIVLGLGVSGRSVCNFLSKRGLDFVATDDKSLSFSQFATVSECIEILPVVSSLITSPGISKSHPLVMAAKQQGVEIIGEIELACRQMQRSSQPLIGITGTNGKTTVTLLVTHMLQAAGFEAQAVGNIGTPLLDMIDATGPLVVELSSYQLETMSTKAFQSGVVLNITPDHLDHHGSMEEYAKAKLHLQACLKPQGSFFVHERIKGPSSMRYGFDTSSDVSSDGSHVFRFSKKEIALPSALKGAFTHDAENFLAAYALARDFGVPADICVSAYATFSKPPHRIQFIREIDGVKYYDDSKGTNLDAVIRAVNAVMKDAVKRARIILIAGGVHKGESYTAWIPEFTERVSSIFAIGVAAPLIQADLEHVLPVTIVPSLEDAVRSAREIAKTGDIVLLSPGCSSLDMFKNYKERGEKFQAVVHSL
ncbi:MAG: murD [Chlamydiia bacterium]|nr:murD [Chlamydiia bacterium]